MDINTICDVDVQKYEYGPNNDQLKACSGLKQPPYSILRTPVGFARHRPMMASFQVCGIIGLHTLDEISLLHCSYLPITHLGGQSVRADL